MQERTDTRALADVALRALHNGPCLHHSTEFYSSLKGLLYDTDAILKSTQQAQFLPLHPPTPRVSPRHAFHRAPPSVLDNRHARIPRFSPSRTHVVDAKERLMTVHEAVFEYSRLDRFCSPNYPLFVLVKPICQFPGKQQGLALWSRQYDANMKLRRHRRSIIKSDCAFNVQRLAKLNLHIICIYIYTLYYMLNSVYDSLRI